MDAKTLEKFFDEQLLKLLPQFAYQFMDEDDFQPPTKKYKRILSDWPTPPESDSGGTSATVQQPPMLTATQIKCDMDCAADPGYSTIKHYTQL